MHLPSTAVSKLNGSILENRAPVALGLLFPTRNLSRRVCALRIRREMPGRSKKTKKAEKKLTSAEKLFLKNVKAGKLEMVQKMLAKSVSANTSDEEGHAALILATYYEHAAVVKELLRHEADVNAVDKDGAPALLFAGAKLNMEILELLLEAGTAITAATTLGNTVLHTALYGEKDQDKAAEVAQRLIRYGSIVNATTSEGHTPLFLAAHFGHVKAAKVLLEADSLSFNAADSGGATPLHHACQHQQPEMVDLLLSVGAEPNARTKSRETPLMLVCGFGTDTAKVTQVVRKLLQAKADANLQHTLGETALMAAARKRLDEAIRCLVIEGGAQLSMRHQDGDRAVDRAPRRSSTRALLEQLERDGADEVVLTKYAGPRRSSDVTPTATKSSRASRG